jgi:hypothetical protein
MRVTDLRLKIWEEKYPSKDSLLAVVPAQHGGNNQSREDEAGFESITAV